MKSQRVGCLVAGLIAGWISAGALAHGDHPSGTNTDREVPAAGMTTADPTGFGRPGNPSQASRTLVVAMNDRMRYSPAVLDVRRGETVRIVARNDGQVLHELVLGTPETLEAHAASMRNDPAMKHDEANMVHVRPGASGEIVWTFDQAGEVAFACLVPGHFEAGMVGKVTVR